MNVDTIINATADYFGMRPCDLLGPGRSKTRIKARFIACSLVRERLDLSYPELARIFGYNDHTSAMNGVRRARFQRTKSDIWARAFTAIENAILDWREEASIETLEMF